MTTRPRKRSKLGADGKPTEATIQKSILDALSRHPCVALAWRQNAGAMRDKSGYVVRMGPEGMADIGGIMSDGRALQIEVKRQGQRVKEGSPQAEWLERCADAGAVCGVAHSVNEALAILGGW